MPELPEVETVRRDLSAVLTGQTVNAVSVTGRRSVRRQSVPDFVAALQGRRMGEVRRHGKFLIIDLDGGGDALVVHLRMSGQLRLSGVGESLVKHTHVVIALRGAPGIELRFVDPRTFGEMFVEPVVGPEERPRSLVGLGPDALDHRLTAARLRARLITGRRTLGLKAALLDQRVIAGVGNIYADEALFAARLSPERPAASVTVSEAGALFRHTRRILRDAVAARGSSFRDAAYVDAYGQVGAFAARHRVYGRPGLPCLRCGTPIEKGVVAARGTHFCPQCQPVTTVRDARASGL